MLTATLLALAAAVLHAGWNLLVKTSADRDLTVWGQFVFGGLLFLPVVVFTGLPDPAAYPFLALSAVVHVAYVSALVAAYDHGDFSLTYPLARGSGALIATIGGVALLGDDLAALAWLAILVVVVGLLALVGGEIVSRSALWAVLTGLTIGTYTLIDAEGARRSAGVPYGVTLTAMTGFGITVRALIRGRAGDFAASLKSNWWRYAVAGWASTLAYVLVLVAVRLAPVGYVAMLRESSVVIGAYAGWALLGERLGRRRLAASSVVATGLVLLVAVR